MATTGEKHVRQWGEPMTATGEKPMAVDKKASCSTIEALVPVAMRQLRRRHLAFAGRQI
jgi:hypothetical protein